MRASYLSTLVCGAAAFRTNIQQHKAQVSDCLCVFDVDRTLTARQGETNCPGTEPHPEIPDWAYYGGTLITSDLGLKIKSSSTCGNCYFGAVSAGTASGPNSAERAYIDRELVAPELNPGGWVDNCPRPVTGTKILACGEGAKQTAVDDIRTWLEQTHGITIEPSKVHFFDDKQNNVEGFQWHSTQYNAHQISCGSRDGSRGLCGGTAAELEAAGSRPGNNLCVAGSAPAAVEEGAVFEMGSPGVPGEYSVSDGKCAGRWIEFWQDGHFAHYGEDSQISSVDDCKDMCDMHPECGGFYVKNGKCSHWRSGRVLPVRPAAGHQCYSKGGGGGAPAPPPAPRPHHHSGGGSHASGNCDAVGGYNVAAGKCSGRWIEFWQDGHFAHYGEDHQISSVQDCADTCDMHPECAGFYTKDGKCSHWRSGGVHASPKAGHCCYSK